MSDLRAVRWPARVSMALPVLAGAAGAAARLSVSPPDGMMVLPVLAGLLLGAFLAQALLAVAQLSGHGRDTRPAPSARRAWLLRERAAVERTLRGMELDAALHRLDEEEAARLADPLRRREDEIRRDLLELDAGGQPGFEEQVRAEMDRRRERRGR